jgi:hypothetical protein
MTLKNICAFMYVCVPSFKIKYISTQMKYDSNTC